ncbi:MAG: bis(5'-nucleosyl)-tetraphosphatase (symmetrical) YqeK [Mobilitalea sp.]
MTLEYIRDNLDGVLKKSRFQHSIGVEEVACDLAAIYGYDVEKAGLAGLLHDCAKNLSDQELLDSCKENNITVSKMEERFPYLLHGKVGAVLAESKYEVKDEEILDSIRYHTTGRPDMTLLDKIIFTADYIEPYREPLPRIEDIRWTAYTDLDYAVTMIYDNILSYLNEIHAEIDHMSEEAYEYYKTLIEARE